MSASVIYHWRFVIFVDIQRNGYTFGGKTCHLKVLYMQSEYCVLADAGRCSRLAGRWHDNSVQNTEHVTTGGPWLLHAWRAHQGNDCSYTNWPQFHAMFIANIFYLQLRDIRAVGVKFYHVLYPKEKSSLLKDCKHSESVPSRMIPICLFLFSGDLWGPLVLCTFLATILQGNADSAYDGGPEFAQVFVIVWIGAAIVTLNSKLLGGNM